MRNEMCIFCMGESFSANRGRCAVNVQIGKGKRDGARFRYSEDLPHAGREVVCRYKAGWIDAGASLGGAGGSLGRGPVGCASYMKGSGMIQKGLYSIYLR